MSIEPHNAVTVSTPAVLPPKPPAPGPRFFTMAELRADAEQSAARQARTWGRGQAKPAPRNATDAATNNMQRGLNAERRAMAALAKIGPATTAQVATATTMARERALDTLNRLVAKGRVTQVRGTGKGLGWIWTPVKNLATPLDGG